MAITALGSLGSSNDKSTGRTLTLSPSRAVPAGRLLVIWYANDSIYNVGISTDAGNFFRAKDTQGNIWCTIAAAVDGRCFFRCGALAQLYACQLRYPLSTGDIITVEAGNHDPGSTWAKAMSVEEFDLGARMRWCLPHNGEAQTGVAIALDPPGLSRSVAGEPKEVLYLYCLGAEGPNTDSYTWDGTWTQVAGNGTTGGADDENIHVRGSYKIEEASSASINVTSDTADRDNIAVMNAIFATRRRRAFPTTPLIDDFNRADEAPLDNGIWDTSSRKAFYGGHLNVESNQAANSSGGGGSWLLDEWEKCGEAYMTIVNFDNNIHCGHGIHYFGAGNSQNGTMFSCGASWALTYGMMNSVLFFGVSDIHGAAKITGAGGETGASVILGHWQGADGHKMGIQRLKDRAVIDSDVGCVDHLWIDRGDGWEEVAACIRFYGSFIPSAGEAAFSCHSAVGINDDFGGGQIRCPAPLPQIYRRPNE